MTAESGLTAIKTLIRDLGDMACIGCRAKTCPACSLAAEITNEVHLLARHEPVLPPATTGDHPVTEYGTTRCPRNGGIAAYIDDEDGSCSSCGERVR